MQDSIVTGLTAIEKAAKQTPSQKVPHRICICICVFSNVCFAFVILFLIAFTFVLAFAFTFSFVFVFGINICIWLSGWESWSAKANTGGAASSSADFGHRWNSHNRERSDTIWDWKYAKRKISANTITPCLQTFSHSHPQLYNCKIPIFDAIKKMKGCSLVIMIE